MVQTSAHADRTPKRTYYIYTFLPWHGPRDTTRAVNWPKASAERHAPINYRRTSLVVGKSQLLKMRQFPGAPHAQHRGGYIAAGERSAALGCVAHVCRGAEAGIPRASTASDGRARAPRQLCSRVGLMHSGARARLHACFRLCFFTPWCPAFCTGVGLFLPLRYRIGLVCEKVMENSVSIVRSFGWAILYYVMDDVMQACTRTWICMCTVFFFEYSLKVCSVQLFNINFLLYSWT